MRKLFFDTVDELHRKFLRVMSVSDGFTAEQAEFLWGASCEKLLEDLTAGNAFISCDPDDGDLPLSSYAACMCEGGVL